MDNNIAVDPSQQPSIPQNSPSTRTVQGIPRFSKTFIILIVVILIAVVGMGGYFLGANQNQVTQNQTQPVPPITQPSPTPDPTENWKTYVNNKVGFEIKYPSPDELPYVVVGSRGGQPKDVDGSEDNTVIDFPGLGPKYDVAFSLELFSYSGILEDLPRSLTQTRLFGYSELEKPPIFKKTTINDNETIWFKRTETKDERKIGEVTYEIYLVAKNHAFIFHINSELSENEIDQILSTFQFSN